MELEKATKILRKFINLLNGKENKPYKINQLTDAIETLIKKVEQ